MAREDALHRDVHRANVCDTPKPHTLPETCTSAALCPGDHKATLLKAGCWLWVSQQQRGSLVLGFIRSAMRHQDTQ